MKKYKKPIMELLLLNEEDVILTSSLEVDPDKPLPDVDGEIWW